jgi:hypothetical protein
MPQGAVRKDREKRKPKKDKAVKELSRAPSTSMNVEVVPRKRKPREEEDEDEE